MEIKELTKDQGIEIAKLAFGQPDWIKSDFDFQYQPYIEEHYEDAREYVSIIFEAYFVGELTTKYKIEISPKFDVWLWYLDIKSEVYHPLGIVNQRLIQQKFSEFGLNN